MNVINSVTNCFIRILSINLNSFIRVLEYYASSVNLADFWKLVKPLRTTSVYSFSYVVAIDIDMYMYSCGVIIT